jgi:hypothetical protein
VEAITMQATDQMDAESAARQGMYHYQTVPCPECGNPMTTWETHEHDEDDIGPTPGKVVKHSIHTPGGPDCIINQVIFDAVPLRDHLRQLGHTLVYVLRTPSEEIDPEKMFGVVSSMIIHAEKVVSVFKRYNLWHDPTPKKGEYIAGDGI